jgi:hypothetical protein
MRARSGRRSIDSNLSELVRRFQQSDVLEHRTVLLSFLDKYWYYASFRHQDSHIGKTYDLAHADPRPAAPSTDTGSRPAQLARRRRPGRAHAAAG